MTVLKLKIEGLLFGSKDRRCSRDCLKKGYDYMNYSKYGFKLSILLIGLLGMGVLLLGSARGNSSGSCETPTRLVIIRGNVTELDHPTLGTTSAVGTLVFQKVGCDACYVGAKINAQGRYEILVGDGKYRVMYMDPIEDLDYLAPDQPRFIDTETIESKKFSKSVFDFDIKLKAVASTRRPGE